MKRVLSAALALVLTVVCMLAGCLMVDAHSGRTDAQGGHYDRSTGEYHCHHGYPAHQHPNGVCPYEDIDKSYENDSESPVSSASVRRGNILRYAVVAFMGVFIGAIFSAICADFLLKRDKWGAIFLVGFGIGVVATFIFGFSGYLIAKLISLGTGIALSALYYAVQAKKHR